MIKQTSTIIAVVFLVWTAFGISAAEERLLVETDLEYLGAFRVPQGDFGSPQYSGFNYGGTALTYLKVRHSGGCWHIYLDTIAPPQSVTWTPTGGAIPFHPVIKLMDYFPPMT